MKREEEIITGTFISNARGFGFIEAEGQKEDLFVPPEETMHAFPGDIVEAVLLSQNGRHRDGRRREAGIVRILEHKTKTVVGTFEKKSSFGFLRPDNAKIGSDIFIKKEDCGEAADGCKAVAEIIDYGSRDKKPEGRITEVLGWPGEPGVDVLSIVRAYDIPETFSEKALNQARKAAMQVSEADMAGRRDFRDLLMVTIDGEDAKDLDDAVSVTFDKAAGCYRLGVHIADVTNYVQENSALDREAKKRGTSVYLADRVIPMLPPVLSNGICSLNEGEDRLALSCLMTVDESGKIIDYDITESVICVDRRMSYTIVQKLLEEEDGEACNEYAALVPMLRHMAALSGLLRKKRMERGAIDFDFPESKILLDAAGRPVEILPYERNTANMLIEDFMLAANETIAQHFYWMEAPFVYRIHEHPDGEKIRKLNIFIRNLGYYMKSVGKRDRKIAEEEVHPKEIQKLLKQVSGTPEEALVGRLALRSLKQARYSTVSSGHFGLACQYYCHFTSPIRRYPDLQIHRIIKDQLRGRLNEDRMEHYRGILEEVCKHSSETERRADEAERETDKQKKVEYMQERIGEVFDGVISGVTAWGLYVELPNTVEGMIHVSRLRGDYFSYREETYEMVGEHTGISYRLGEPVKVRVIATDLFLRTIDFELWEENENEQGSHEAGCK